MYAIAFDMRISDLVDNYGEPYNNAYYEIKQVLGEYDFVNPQGSVYLTTNTSMANLYNAIQGRLFLVHLVKYHESHLVVFVVVNLLPCAPELITRLVVV